MDKEQVCRTLQNIIDINHVWEYQQFNHEKLDELINNELKRLADEKQLNKDAYREIEQLITKHLKTIKQIEKNEIDINLFRDLTEDIRSWKRHYLL